MIHQLYSIKDSKAGFYHSPFTCQNEVIAKRTVAMAANQANTAMNFESESFDLYRLCQFDDVSGKIEVSEITFICNIGQLTKKESKS